MSGTSRGKCLNGYCIWKNPKEHWFKTTGMTLVQLTRWLKERLGYPTQKPEALLERIVSASSNEGDVVLDPFCGCGTAIAAAERLNRRWIGIDITHIAITLIRHRLRDTFKDELKPYEVLGQPQDVASALALATDSENSGRYQFEWWGLGPRGRPPRPGPEERRRLRR